MALNDGMTLEASFPSQSDLSAHLQVEADLPTESKNLDQHKNMWLRTGFGLACLALLVAVSAWAVDPLASHSELLTKPSHDFLVHEQQAGNLFRPQPLWGNEGTCKGTCYGLDAQCGEDGAGERGCKCFHKQRLDQLFFWCGPAAEDKTNAALIANAKSSPALAFSPGLPAQRSTKQTLLSRPAVAYQPALSSSAIARFRDLVMQEKKKKVKKDVLELDGVVLEALRGATFRVQLDDTEQEILCSISGKIRKNYIKVLVGDSVTCELSPYDLTKGRITFRRK